MEKPEIIFVDLDTCITQLKNREGYKHFSRGIVGSKSYSAAHYNVVLTQELS